MYMCMNILFWYCCEITPVHFNISMCKLIDNFITFYATTTKTRVSDVCVWIYLLSKPNMNEQMFTFWILNHAVNFTSKLFCNWKEVVTADRTDLFYCHKVCSWASFFCVCVYAFGPMNWIKPQEGLSFPVP